MRWGVIVCLCAAVHTLWAQLPGMIVNRLQLNGELLLGGNAGSAGQVLLSQGVGATPTWADPASLVTISAANGLTKVGSEIRLGGTLSSATDIALAGKVLSFSGAGSSMVVIGATTGSAARLYVSSAAAAYDAIRAVHSSSSTTSAYAAVRGELSGSGYTPVTGFLGYHASNNKTFGVRTIGGDYGAWFEKPVAITPGTIPPTTTADLEVRNTSTGAPVQVLLRQTTAVSSAGAVLASVDFGDNFTTAAQAQIRVLRGGSGSSSSLPTELSFWVTPAGSTTPVERLRLSSSGNLGLGVAAPQAQLHQNGDAGSVHKFTAGAATGTAASDGFDIGIGSDGTAFLRQRENAPLLFYANDQPWLRLEPTGELIVHKRLIAQSARRFKQDIRPLEGAAELLSRLRGVRFRWKPEFGGTEDIGFLAEEVAEVLPEVVQRNPATGEIEGVDYTRIVAVVVEAFKAQQQRLEQLMRQLEALEREVQHLRQLLR